VVEAFFWGAIGAAALLIGALIAYFLNPSRQVIAIVMAIGTGLLIGSVSFELVDDALENQAVAGWRPWFCWAHWSLPLATGC
jgi:zinc transporter, ZIP family